MVSSRDGWMDGWTVCRLDKERYTEGLRRNQSWTLWTATLRDNWNRQLGKSLPSRSIHHWITISLKPYPRSISPSRISLRRWTRQPQPFVKVVKNKAYFKRYQVKYRRRRGE